MKYRWNKNNSISGIFYTNEMCKKIREEIRERSRKRTEKFRKDFLEAKKNGTEKAFFEELKKQNQSY